MKKIYIVLTQTGTALSTIAGLLTHKKYNHASISMDIELNQLYGFGRLNPYNPFWGGFVHEGIDVGTFKRFKRTVAQIYEKEVTDKQYELMINEIKNIELHKKEYSFNILGLIMVLFNKKVIKKNSMYCAEFVCHILKTGNVDISKVDYIVKPEDLRKIDDMKLIYDGVLKQYKVPQKENV